jgi:predicted dehydrogenase
VTSGKLSPPTLYDGFKVQEVMEAALKSSDRGNWVKLTG